MQRGFFALGSGMITDTRMLSTISDNLANAKTTGYKRDVATSSTFSDMLISRVDGEITPLGTMPLIRTIDEVTTIHSQGSFQDTSRDLDFAIVGSGFFAVQDATGTRYTRNGSFTVDAEGYLQVSGQGRVLGKTGAPIQVKTDQFSADSAGNIYAGKATAGTVGVYDFADYTTMRRAGNGIYTGQNAALVPGGELRWRSLESSNVDVGQEMTTAMSVQRDLQSCTQALKMYDQLMGAALSQVAKI